MPEKPRENGLSECPLAGHTYPTVGGSGKISVYIIKINFSKFMPFK
jgi:hypothetical protein